MLYLSYLAFSISQIEIILNKLTNTLNDTKVQKHNLAHTLTLTNEQEAN